MLFNVIIRLKSIYVRHIQLLIHILNINYNNNIHIIIHIQCNIQTNAVIKNGIIMKSEYPSITTESIDYNYSMQSATIRRKYKINSKTKQQYGKGVKE